MGNWYAKYVSHPDIIPDAHSAPSFDPMLGFPNGRKPRVMIATEQEMMAAQLPINVRDYCAHHFLDYEKCRHLKFPFVFRCAHERHTWETCEYEDYVLRMKEFEREKRLRERAKRKAEQALAA